MGRSARVALVAVSCAVALSCSPDRTKEHASYVSARTVLAACAARAEGDLRCSEEPACGTAIASLEALPSDSPDHAEVVALLAAVRSARTSAPVVEAQRPDPEPPVAVEESPPPGKPAASAGTVAEVAPPPQLPAGNKKKKNYRDPEDDEDWGLTVVDAVELGGASADPSEYPHEAARPWQLNARPTPPPERLTCAEIQAKIDARSRALWHEFDDRVDYRRRKELGMYGPEVLKLEDNNTFDLSEVSKDVSSLESDGTKNEGRFDDPELKRLRDQLTGCTPP